jgi:hypothetical protein
MTSKLLHEKKIIKKILKSFQICVFDKKVQGKKKHYVLDFKK